MNFDSSKWANIKKNYSLWWKGDLDRPLIAASLSGYRPNRPTMELPFHRFASFYDKSVIAERIIDVWEDQLSDMHYFGDGFPSVMPDFGPGVIAAFAGAMLENGDGTVWFSSQHTQSIKDISLQCDERSYWLNRIKDIFQCAIDRWGGNVLVRMTDLGGSLDILASLRGAENLLLDLYDEPDVVKEKTWQVHQCWWDGFEGIHCIGKEVNNGYSSWCGIYSQEPYYMLQCDFAYMLTTKLFEEFVKPELVKTSHRLSNAFYHLDGIGQLQHLDSILEIESIKGIQWIPGDGQPDISKWPDVYKKIHNAGKRIQFWDHQYEKQNLQILDILTDQIGSAWGIDCIVIADRSREDEILRYLDKYNVPY